MLSKKRIRTDDPAAMVENEIAEPRAKRTKLDESVSTLVLCPYEDGGEYGLYQVAHRSAEESARFFEWIYGIEDNWLRTTVVSYFVHHLIEKNKIHSRRDLEEYMNDYYITEHERRDKIFKAVEMLEDGPGDVGIWTKMDKPVDRVVKIGKVCQIACLHDWC
jgi:hypothetical protein